ncbi:chemotaxis protein MotB [Paucidesulfovibrio gracilis DSM 16080]|uniref:Chemotaxis protein MotB n=1 Tax=Paucidesulfovibrio gracilis DSM 16080 TaxID=1121449 RepID=A0A1T4W4T7_9BACT|nr:flagellar motor protein MotB [Paucidesulfovibrio gracilis]SKA72243.1 chemotaxis protein MotB [Paucidesulfovibrio gracilis DSM 16080]
MPEEDVIIIEQVEDPPPREEGLPPWMATFADMVTLLLCFFVLLLSFTNQDINNFQMLMGAMSDAFGVQKERSDAREIPYADTSRQFKRQVESENDIKQLAASLKKFIQDESLTGEASLSVDNTGVMLRVGNKAMFRPGSSDLMPESISVLVEVIKLLNSTPFNLIVRGHTDGEDLNEQLFDTNWELSATRAAACLRFILEHSSVSPQRLKAVGLAGSKPLVPSTTAANKALNRRVEFYFQAPGAENW